MLQVLVETLNQEFRLGASIDPDGSLYLLAPDGDGLAVSCSPDGRELVFRSLLGMLGGPQDVVLCLAALQLNLHQEATCGGAIGLDPQTQALILSWRIASTGEDPQRLVAALDQFCALAHRLKTELTQAVGEFNSLEAATIHEIGSAHRSGFAHAVQVMND